MEFGFYFLGVPRFAGRAAPGFRASHQALRIPHAHGITHASQFIAPGIEAESPQHEVRGLAAESPVTLCGRRPNKLKILNNEFFLFLIS